MLDKLVNQRVMQVVTKGLDSAEFRQKIIAQNIANVDTPNYKRGLVSFEAELKQALGHGVSLKGAVTNAKHIPINFKPIEEVKAKYHITKEQTLRNDGNNVDINVEMANMAVNSLRFNTLASLLSRRITMLKTAMRNRMS